MDDDEEPDVRRSRVSSPGVQSIGPTQPPPIPPRPPRSFTIRTPIPRPTPYRSRYDHTPRFHQAHNSQPPSPPRRPRRPVRSPSPSSEPGLSYKELLLRALERPITIAHTPAPPATPRKAKRAPPPKFKGVKEENFRIWMRQIEDYFRYHSEDFSTDDSRITWLAGQLSDRALTWYQD